LRINIGGGREERGRREEAGRSKKTIAGEDWKRHDVSGPWDKNRKKRNDLLALVHFMVTDQGRGNGDQKKGEPSFKSCIILVIAGQAKCSGKWQSGRKGKKDVQSTAWTYKPWAASEKETARNLPTKRRSVIKENHLSQNNHKAMTEKSMVARKAKCTKKKELTSERVLKRRRQ